MSRHSVLADWMHLAQTGRSGLVDSAITSLLEENERLRATCLANDHEIERLRGENEKLMDRNAELNDYAGENAAKIEAAQTVLTVKALRGEK